MKAYIEAASGIKLSSRIARLERDYTNRMALDSGIKTQDLADAMRKTLAHIVEQSTCVLEIEMADGRKCIAAA